MRLIERTAALLAAAAALAAMPTVSAARELDYGAISDPALRACDALYWSGQRGRAQDCYRTLLASAAAADSRAEAAWALGDFKQANGLFRAATAAAPASAALRRRWGELYLDTHQPQEALDLFKEALQRDAHDAFAQVDVAGVLADQYTEAAAHALQPLLIGTAVPPGARLRALLLAARMALEDDAPARAAPLLEQASALARQSRLPELEIDAVRAGWEAVRGRSGSAWSERALQADPAFGQAYAIPARFYLMLRRQSEAIALYSRAVAVQPDLWSARVQLASCLLRENRLDEARVQLEAAYRGDPFDPVTVNTLRLLDSLRSFDIRVYGTPTSSRPEIVLRLARSESDVLAPYARRLAERAIASYAQRYHYTLQAPVVIEIYPNHDDFAVRTAGLPGIGLLGVTFGYLVAMDSPSARAVNEFHWGSTLWHEMAHVFTLESTQHRVPRWLSEGLSVFEEWHTGPIKGEEIPGYAFAAFAQHRELPILELDRGFVHPSYEQQLQVSYMQAGLICDFIDRSFGFDRLLALLHAYEHTSDTAQALHEALALSPQEFDRRFAADLEQQFGTLFARLPQWAQARAQADAAARAQDWTHAAVAAHQALALLAQDVDEGSPYLPLARAEQAQHQQRDYLATLEDYWRRGGHEPEALAALADGLQQGGRSADAIAVLESVNDVAPFDEELHGRLGDWLLAAARAPEARTEYQVALALHPADAALAHLRLARAEYALHALPEAHREVLAALDIAPNYVPAQQLLLRLAQPPATP
jgi:tetratricopeptide (TPR) repeat protein